MRVMPFRTSLPPWLAFGVRRLTSFLSSYEMRTRGTHTGFGGEGLQLLTEDSNAFSGNLSKAVTALLCLKIPMVSASKFRRKNHCTTSGWLSGYPICHLLGHAPSIKTASGTHSFADCISTSKNFRLWQQEK